MTECVTYDILGRIGEGQFGTVDVLRSIADNRLYAIKTIAKSKAIDVSLEKHVHALAASKLFPFIPHLHDFYQSSDALHIITYFCACGTLGDLCVFGGLGGFDLEGGTSIRPDEHKERVIRYYASQVVLGIGWLHETAGLIHRDIKPQNCLVDLGGRVKLCDFGSAARLVDETSSRAHSTDTSTKRDRKRSPPTSSQPHTIGMWPKPRRIALEDCAMMHGTPDYIAPEIITFYESAVIDGPCAPDPESHRRVGYDASVDWWSFGVMLFELIYGRPAFWARDIRMTHSKVLDCENSLRFPVNPKISPELEGFIQNILVPADKRLGRRGPTQIRSHAWFDQNTWTDFTQDSPLRPPSWLDPPGPIDLDDLDDSFAAGLGSGGWDDEEDESAGGTTITGAGKSGQVEPGDAEAWSDWPWAPSESKSSAAEKRSIAQRHENMGTALATPARQASTLSDKPPRTIPRTVLQQKILLRSDKKAMDVLKACVLQSARKKVERDGADDTGGRGSGSCSVKDRHRVEPARGREGPGAGLGTTRTFLDRLNEVAGAKGGECSGASKSGRIALGSRGENGQGGDTARAGHDRATASGVKSSSEGCTDDTPARDVATPDLVHSGSSRTSTEIVTAEEAIVHVNGRSDLHADRAPVDHAPVYSSDLDKAREGVVKLQDDLEVISRALSTVRTRLTPRAQSEISPHSDWGHCKK